MDQDLRSALARISVVSKILNKANNELSPDEVAACGDILSEAYSDLLENMDDNEDPEPIELEPKQKLRIVP